jgi:enterochelin esterase-like enzyme
MSAWRRVAVLVLALLAVGLAGAAMAGEIERVAVPSRVLGRSWPVLIYQPDPAAGEADARYPVVYLLHGANSDATSWVEQGHLAALMDHLIATRRIPPCLVVMPSVGNSWYLDGAEPIETAFVQDLVPWVDRHEPGAAERAERAIAGVSMGGYGAVHLALAHPELFDRVAALSPAVYVPEPPAQSAARRAAVFQRGGVFDPALWRHLNYPPLLDRLARGPWRVKLFVSAGTEDGLHTSIAGAILAQAWRAHGQPARYHAGPGHHDFALWRHDLVPALVFLLKGKTLFSEEKNPKTFIHMSRADSQAPAK